MSRHTEPTSLPTFAEYRRQPDFGCSVDPDFDSWLIAPCGQNRDSDTVTRSNFAAQCAEMEDLPGVNGFPGGSEDFQILCFNHWACGWVEIVIVRPESAAAVYAVELAEQLQDYPVVNDEALSELESNEADESWDSYGARDFRHELSGKFREVARVAIQFVQDEATNEQLREWMEEMHPNYPYETHSDGTYFPISQAVDAIGRDELAKFVRSMRKAGAK